MNISNVQYYTGSTYTEKQTFKGNKNTILNDVHNSTLLNSQEIIQCIKKITNKTKFLNKVLGCHAKTSKAVSMNIGNTDVFINMDKTKPGFTKIDIFSDTNNYSYIFSQELQQSIPVKIPGKHRQSMNIIVNDKDGRMINGSLECDAGHLNFERNSKTGRRNGGGQGIYPFVLSPNLAEYPTDWEAQKWYADKGSNTISTVFSSIFIDLMRVKPNLKLI